MINGMRPMAQIARKLYFAKAKARACKKVLHLTQTLLLHLTVQPSNEAQLQDLMESVSSLILQFEDFLKCSSMGEILRKSLSLVTR